MADPATCWLASTAIAETLDEQQGPDYLVSAHPTGACVGGQSVPAGTKTPGRHGSRALSWALSADWQLQHSQLAVLVNFTHLEGAQESGNHECERFRQFKRWNMIRGTESLGGAGVEF
jgi:hypothetical protein